MPGVRMGEIAVAGGAEELVALGLGSCIGLAIVDWRAGVAGLAHVVLPHSGGRAQQPGRFADTAVPALVSALRGAGASPRRLRAVIAGGAQMFRSSASLDVGARNDRAVREALCAARITLGAARTGGAQGRTLRVSLAEGLVTVRVAGEPAATLLEAPDPPGATDRRCRPAGSLLIAGRP
ncbi:MAG TPA: chemotaxis protein CheD [Solirubrobacteraceae bacterium]|nr:chemotaxis protein CheD [Solirubrobacteraceae bacterium]